MKHSLSWTQWMFLQMFYKDEDTLIVRLKGCTEFGSKYNFRAFIELNYCWNHAITNMCNGSLYEQCVTHRVTANCPKKLTPTSSSLSVREEEDNSGQLFSHMHRHVFTLTIQTIKLLFFLLKYSLKVHVQWNEHKLLHTGCLHNMCCSKPQCPPKFYI